MTSNQRLQSQIDELSVQLSGLSERSTWLEKENTELRARLQQVEMRLSEIELAPVLTNTGVRDQLAELREAIMALFVEPNDAYTIQTIAWKVGKWTTQTPEYARVNNQVHRLVREKKLIKNREIKMYVRT